MFSKARSRNGFWTRRRGGDPQTSAELLEQSLTQVEPALVLEGLRSFPEVSCGIELDTEAFGVIDIYNMAELTSFTFDIHQQQLQIGLLLIAENRHCKLTFRLLHNVSIESDQYVFEQMKSLEFESLTFGAQFFAETNFNLEFETNFVTVKMLAQGVTFEELSVEAATHEKC